LALGWPFGPAKVLIQPEAVHICFDPFPQLNQIYLNKKSYRFPAANVQWINITDYDEWFIIKGKYNKYIFEEPFLIIQIIKWTLDTTGCVDSKGSFPYYVFTQGGLPNAYDL